MTTIRRERAAVNFHCGSSAEHDRSGQCQANSVDHLGPKTAADERTAAVSGAKHLCTWPRGVRVTRAFTHLGLGLSAFHLGLGSSLCRRFVL